MSSSTYAQFILSVLGYLAVFAIGTALCFRYAKPTARQKKFLLGVGTLFLPVLALVFAVPTATSLEGRAPTWLGILFSLCLVTAGVSTFIYAKDAERLHRDVRSNVKAGKLLVPYVMPSQSYMIPAGILVFCGFFILTMLFLGY